MHRIHDQTERGHVLDFHYFEDVALLTCEMTLAMISSHVEEDQLAIILSMFTDS